MKRLLKLQNKNRYALIAVITIVLFIGLNGSISKIFADECCSKPNEFMTSFDWKDGSTTIIEKEFTCKNCGKQRYEFIDFGEIFNGSGDSTEKPTEHSHSYTDMVTAPTCTEKGYTTYTCDCGDSYVDDYTDALGHDYNNGVCTRCAMEDPDNCSHLFNSSNVEATCTEPGGQKLTCVKCGYSEIKIKTEDALGHNYIDGVCKNCGEAVPEHNHLYNSSNVKATCTEAGGQVNTCAVCGYSYLVVKTEDASGHDYIDGVCKNCGEKEESETN